MTTVGRETSIQAGVASIPDSSVRLATNSLPARDRRTWLVVIALASLVLYAFMPVLTDGFVAWDDEQNFLTNPYFRGLSPAQLKWDWTTFWLGVYQPLGWMLYGAQYLFCQLDPRGYHLTSLLLQVADAVVLYFLTVSVLVRCPTNSHLESPWSCFLSAGLATALFAVHPLRVEAVAWVSCQPYLPSVLFAMLSVLAYLHAFRIHASPRWFWLAASFLLFVTALLFKVVAMSLPAVLLILDVYPLRRFSNETGRGFGASAWRALLEKVPFVIVSLVFMGLAIAARDQSPLLVERYSASEGIAQACYGIWFYIVKTVLPLGIATFYPLPNELNWLSPPYILSILATLAISAGLFLVRRRWPGLLAAWLSYLVILAPTSGIIRGNSHVITADRYSYMAMLGSVMLVAEGFRRFWQMSSRWHPDAPSWIAIFGLGAVLVFTGMTRNQCRTWLNSETLWTQAVAHGAGLSDLAHYNLGLAVQANGNYQAAQAHFTEALRLNPRHVDAHNNLGILLARQMKYGEAQAHYAAAIRLRPSDFRAHYNLGLLRAKQGMHAAATVQFAEAVRLNPRHVSARQDLGNAYFRLGKYDEARAQFGEAIRLDPQFAEAYNANALIITLCPDIKFRDAKSAVEFATRACELTKWKDPRFLNTLAAAHAEAGDFDAAVSTQTKAVDLLPDERQKGDYRSRLALYQANRHSRKPSS